MYCANLTCSSSDLNVAEHVDISCQPHYVFYQTYIMQQTS